MDVLVRLDHHAAFERRARRDEQRTHRAELVVVAMIATRAAQWPGVARDVPAVRCDSDDRRDAWAALIVKVRWDLTLAIHGQLRVGTVQPPVHGVFPAGAGRNRGD